MFLKDDRGAAQQVSTRQAVRHLLVFQFKLAMDALRDLFLSPVSIAVFIADAIRKPSVEDSLYLRLMRLGRRSDRVINLFDEYADAGHYTVDQTLSEVERAVFSEDGKPAPGTGKHDDSRGVP